MFRLTIDALTLHECTAFATAGNLGIPDRCVRKDGRWYFYYR